MDTTADATWLPGVFGGVSGFIGICVVPLINKKLEKRKPISAFRLLHLSLIRRLLFLLASSAEQCFKIWQCSAVYDYVFSVCNRLSYCGKYIYSSYGDSGYCRVSSL